MANMEISQLAIQVKSDGITQATTQLDGLTASAIKAEASTKSFETSASKLTVTQKTATETSSNYLVKLQQQVDLLGKNQEFSSTYIATSKKLEDSQIKLAGTLGAEIDSWKSLGEAQREAIAMNAALERSTKDLEKAHEKAIAMDAARDWKLLGNAQREAISINNTLDAAQKALTETSTKHIGKLQQQVDLLGKNKEQTAMYLASNKGLAESEVVLVGQLAAKLDAWKVLGEAQKEAIAINTALDKSAKLLGETEEQQAARLSKMSAATMEWLAAQKAEQDAAIAYSLKTSNSPRTSSSGRSSTAMQMTPSITKDEEAATKAIKDAEALKAANIELENSFQKVMKVADPYGTKLIANAEAMDVLTRAQKAGLIGINEYQAAMSRLLSIKDTTIAKELTETEKAARLAAGGFDTFSLSSARAKSELITVGREIANGNWTRLPGSISILADRTGVLGGAITLLANPLTWVVAGLGALVIAATVGAGELLAFNKALTITGGYSQLTADQFGNLSKELGKIGEEGQHGAAKALTEIASLGKFTGEQLGVVGKAAVEMQEATGQAVKVTAKEFEKLKDEPVKATLELNDKYHYLTVSVYEQIKALEDQGKHLEAGNLAIHTMADSIANRVPAEVENIGLLEKAWKAVKGAIVGATNAAMGIGRDKTSQEQIAALQERIDFNNKDSKSLFGLSPKAAANANAILQQQIADIQKHAAAMDISGFVKSSQVEADERAVKADALIRNREDHNSKEIKFQIARNKLEQEYLDLKGGSGAQSELLKGVKFDVNGHPSGGRFDVDLEDARKKIYGSGRKDRGNEYAINAQLEKQKGLFDEQERSLAEYIKYNKTQYEIGAIDTNQWLDNDLKKKTEVYTKEYQLALKNEEIASAKKNKTAMERYANDAAKALDKLTNSFAVYAETSAKLREKDKESVENYTEKLAKAYQVRQDVIDNSLATMGLGNKQKAEFDKKIKAQEDFDKEMADLRTKHNTMGPNGIDDYVFGQNSAQAKANYDKRLAQESKFAADTLEVQSHWQVGASRAFANYQENAANVAGQAETVFTNAFTNMGNALETFATTGKLNFKGLVVSILADIAKMEARAATSSIFGMLTSMIGGWFGGGSSYGMKDMAMPAAGFVKSAMGNVFDNGEVRKFADGGSFTNGIVSSPTNFNMGQMGEAGPEAIVPLTRTSDGSLGVKQTGSSGSGGPIIGNLSTVVHITDSGATANTKTDSNADQNAKQFAQMMATVAQAEIGKQMRQGGLLWKMKNGQTGS